MRNEKERSNEVNTIQLESNDVNIIQTRMLGGKKSITCMLIFFRYSMSIDFFSEPHESCMLYQYLYLYLFLKQVRFSLKFLI